MAKATAQNITRTVNEFDGVQLILSPAEARALLAVTNMVGGPQDRSRGHVERISTALAAALPDVEHEKAAAILRKSSGSIQLEASE